MAKDFDYPPLYDELTRFGADRMSAVWLSWFASFMDTLVEYMGQYGVFVPRVTTEERDSIDEPVNGQLIYNTTLDKFQGYENGAWANLI